MKLEAKFRDGAVRLDAKFSDGAVRLDAKFRETQILEVGKKAVIEPLEVTVNGEYTAPDGVDGYSPVVVSVPVPEGYIRPEGTLEVNENGTHDVTAFASVNVNVQTGGGAGDSNYEVYEGSYIVTPSVSNQTLDTANKLMQSDVIIEEIPYAEVSNNSGGKTASIG